MKTNVIIILIIYACAGISAQDISTSANGLKTEKQLKRERLEAEKYMQYQAIGYFLDSMQFVLEAEYLSNNGGIRSIVSPSLNFIRVDSMKGSIQTGQNFGLGRNGVGGATAKGTITEWKLTKNEKKKTYFVRINFSTDLGFYTVFMDVFADGTASARLTGMGRGGLIFDGTLVPLKRTRIFQATSGF